MSLAYIIITAGAGAVLGSRIAGDLGAVVGGLLGAVVGAISERG